MINFEKYDTYLINEIGRHLVEPNPVQKMLALAGKPIDKVLGIANSGKIPVLKDVQSTIVSTVEKTLEKTIRTANKLFTEQDILKEYNKRSFGFFSIDAIRYASLEQMDQVADSYNFSNAIFVGLEGAVMGVASTLSDVVPFAQMIIPTIIASDVTASLILLSRHVCQIATSYGYSSQNAFNLPHILAAMAPTTASSDEGYLLTKNYAVTAVREAGQYMAQNSGKLLDKQLLQSAPQLVKLISYVTERIGIQITEKELGMIIPVAGAVLNGGVNVAFQQAGHIIAKDYFRQLILEERYGYDEVQQAIFKRIVELRAKKVS